MDDNKLIEALRHCFGPEKSAPENCKNCPFVGQRSCDNSLIRTVCDRMGAVLMDNSFLLAQLAEKDKEFATAVKLIDQVDDVAMEALECGPYQDGEEAGIFGRIARMTRRGLQETGGLGYGS